MTEILREDFSSGAISSVRWQSEVTGGGDTPTVVSLTAGGRTSQVAKYRCAPSTQRSELAARQNSSVIKLFRHTRVVTRRKLLFPTGFPINTTEWQLAGQWKDLALSTNPNGQSTSPPISLGARRGQLEMRSSFRGIRNFVELQFMPVSLNVWYDLVFDVWLDGKPGAAGNQGAGEVTIYRVNADGTLTTLLNKWQPGEGTFYTDGGQDYTVLRHGLYHNTTVTADTIFYEDDVVIATGADALDNVMGGTVVTPGGGGTTPTPPSTPAAPTLTQSNGVVTAQWLAVTGATSYQLWRRALNTTTWGRVGAQVSGLTTTDAPGVGSWQYAVSAVNAAGESPQSAATSITIATAPPPSGVLKNGGLPSGLADVWDLDPNSANINKFSRRMYRGGAVPTTASTEFTDAPPFSAATLAKHAFVASDVIAPGGKAFKLSIPSANGVTSRYSFKVNAPDTVITPTNIVDRWYRVIFKVDADNPTAMQTALDAHGDDGTWFFLLDAPGSRFNNTPDNGPYGPFSGSDRYPDAKRHWRTGSNSGGTPGTYYAGSKIDFGPLIIGKTYDVLIHRVWSRTASGKAEAWVDGVATNVYSGPTVESVSFGTGNAQFEHRVGWYWGGGFTVPVQATIYAMKIGTTRVQVASDVAAPGLPAAPVNVKAVVGEIPV